MITCPNCNKQLEDGTKFCDNCGKQIVETIFCQNCGKQTSTEFAFCQNCGTSLSNEAVVSDDDKKEKFALSKLSFKISKKLIAIGSVSIALVLVVAIVLTTLLSGSGNKNSALYLKDGEMYFTNISKIDPWQVTSRLGIDNVDLADLAYALGYYIHLSNDGKNLFYVDKITGDSDGASLFYRYVNKLEREPVKIDSDIVSYSVSENGKLVTYLKSEGRILYQHDLTDKEKIDSEVSDFRVSDDGKKICYINKEGGMYFKYAGKDKEKIDSEVSCISYINKGFNTVFYLKEGSLYRKVEGKDKEKIASDVSSVIKIYESGEVYYLKSDSSEVTLIDYIEDDLKDLDASMTEPRAPEYPSYWDYDDYDNYQLAVDQYETAYEAYQIAREAWYDKQDRDELRENLAGKTITNASYTLCYYNGKEERVLTDAFASGDYSSNYTVADDNPVIIFSIYNQSFVIKVKLSEIEYAYEVEDMVEAALYSSSEKYVAIKDRASVIEQTDATSFDITPDGKTVYFLDDVSEESGHGDLYKMTISGGKAQKPELYDSDVHSSSAFLVNNDKFVYYKDVKGSKGELYVDKQKIDYDVNLYKITYFDELDAIVYMVDWNDAKDYGTLKMFEKGKAVKIADDVHAYNMTPNGEVLYLYDYSTSYNKGELFIYKGNTSKKIDDDVVAIIPIYDLKYRGRIYNGR